MENQELLQKIKSVKSCLMAHPDNEKGSEFEDRISDLEEIEDYLSKDKWIKIESKDDFPDEISGLWEVVMNGKQVFIELLKDNKSRLYEDFKKDGITHYKIREKSQLPID